MASYCLPGIASICLESSKLLELLADNVSKLHGCAIKQGSRLGAGWKAGTLTFATMMPTSVGNSMRTSLLICARKQSVHQPRRRLVTRTIELAGSQARRRASIMMTARATVRRVTPPMNAPAPISAKTPGSIQAQALGGRKTPGGALRGISGSTWSQCAAP